LTNFFEVSKQSLSSKARLGSINTVHGEVKTPSFIFCGTKATVKSILPHQLRSAKSTWPRYYFQRKRITKFYAVERTNDDG